MRGTMIVFVIALAISAALIGGSVYFSNEVDRSFQAQQRKLTSIRTRYHTVDEERGLIEQYLPAFARLEARGIIGEELRLNWIESLRETGRRHKIPSLRYEVDKQAPFKPGFDLDTGSFKLFESKMDVTLGLLHEEDLFRLLRELERRAAGLYSVEACSLKRAGDGVVEQPKAQNVRVECTLRWITINKREKAV